MDVARFIRRSFVFLIGIIFACSAPPAFSSDVTLKLKAGGLTISGKLINFDGQNYLIESQVLGAVRVSAEKFSCVSAECPDTPVKPNEQTGNASVRIVGSSAIGGRLMPILIGNYAASLGGAVEIGKDPQGDVVFDVVGKDGAKIISFNLKSEGWENAFAALASGAAEIGMTDRAITAEEIAAFTQAGLPNMNRPGHEHVVALDAVVLFVSPKNEINALSTEQILRIFAGEIKDWSAVGSFQGKIKLYAPDETSETSRTFQSLMLQPSGKRIASDVKRFGSNAELVKALADDPGGIGIASFSEMGMAKPLSLKDACGLLLKPSQFSVKSGEYPLSRKLYYYTAKPANDHVASLLAYAISSKASPALGEAGLIDNGLITMPFAHYRDRVIASLIAAPQDFNLDLMRQLIKTLRSGHRLSATMQFESGSTDLDSESVQLLPKIADHLRTSDLSGKQIVLVGYSDSSGQFEHNRALALRRANAVRDVLVNTANGTLKPDDIQLYSYSELFPLACNNTEQGRDKNRRVEIWLVPSSENTRPVVLTQQP